MKRTTSYLLLALVALLAVGVVAAFAADPIAKKSKLVLVGEGHEAESFTLDDLRDGESRTFQGKHGQVTVTRKGGSFEIRTENAEGGEQTIVVTSGDDKDARIVIRKRDGDAEPHVMMLRHAPAKGGATWTAENGETIELKTLDGNLAFVGEGDATQRVFVHRIAAGDHEALAVGADAHGLAWLACDKDTLHFRCADDDVIVGGPKEKFGTAAPSCPVCGKLMEKLPEPPQRVVEVQVQTESSPDARPEI